MSSGASGSGNGTVQFSAAAEHGGHAAHRHAHDRRPDVHRQPGAACRARSRCAEPVANAPAGGGTGSVGGDGGRRVRVDGGQQRAVADDHGGASGSGNGTVQFSVAANPARSRASGTLTIGGQTFTVSQAQRLLVFDLAGEPNASPAGGGNAAASTRDGGGGMRVDGRQQRAAG